MFIGLNFCGDKNSFSQTSTNIQNITMVQITNGIYDDLIGSDNPELKQDDSSKKWDFDTRFYAKFNNNLAAGNIEYTASMVSSVRVKRRKNNEHEWLTLYDIPINTNDDFYFNLIDKYVQAQQEYSYALVPIIGNVECSINKNSIVADFSNYIILDKDVSYPIIFNTSLNTQINKSIGTVTTLGKKYPFVISNGLSQYKSGTLKFSLAPIIDCEIDTQKGHNYRTQFDEWIMNGHPKILKDWSGQIYMINVTSSIPIDYSFYDLPSYEISFTEIGDSLSQDDMYNNNFIDVNLTLSGTYSQYTQYGG